MKGHNYEGNGHLQKENDCISSENEILSKKNISFKYISFVATLSSNPQFFKWITISALSFYTRR